MIRLDIFSDPVCPWCYLGKAQLDRALKTHPEHPFEVEWQPFQLNPEMARDGVDKRAYLAARFGAQPPELWAQVIAELSAKAPVDPS